MNNSNIKPLNKLLSEWNSQDINYCIWKGKSKIEVALNGSDDLDVLVSIEDSGKAEIIAKTQGFLNLVPEEYRSDVGATDFYYYSHPDKKWFHIHIHYQLIFGNGVIRNYHLPIEKELLSTRVWDDKNDLWSISNENDICLFITRHASRKAFFGRYVDFTNEYNELLTYYKDKITTDLPNIYPESVKHFAKESINDNKPSIKGLRKQLLNDLSPNRQTKTFWNKVLPRTIKKSYVKIINRTPKKLTYGNSYLSKGGVLIAFVGIDGSGKSSAIERLSNNLGSRVNTEVISLGSGISGASWYRLLAFKVFGTRAKFKGHKSVRSTNKKSSSEKKNYPWYYLLWLIICLIDKKKELQRGFTAKSRGSLVVSDRWLQTTHDAILDGQRTKNIKPNSFLANYLIRLENDIFNSASRNKPDLIIRFDVSPENSVIRKPNDLTHQGAISATEILESIEWGVDLVTVNANLDIDTVDSLLVDTVVTQLDLHTN